MTMSLLLEHFDGLLATSEDVEQLNIAIVQLALQGKLALQDSREEPAIELLKRIVRSDGNRDLPVIDIASLQLPKNWSAEYLGVIAEQITKGSTPTTYGFQFQSEGIRFVKVENVKNGRIVLENIKDFISEEANRTQLRSQLQAGDVLFSIAGTIGETCVVKVEDLPANTNQALAIIRGTQIVFDPKFLKLQLDSFVANAIKGRARGGAMNNVSLGDLRQLLVFIPPLAEQQRIVARVEELFAQTRALATELAHSQIELDGLNQSALSHLLASETPEEFNQHWEFIAEHFDLLFQTPEHVAPLRQSILELAVRGKLTRREGGDESAKELLKCVHDEKVKLIEEGKLKKEKPLPPIKENEKPFELPNGWEWVRLGDISKSSDYGTSEKASEVDQVPMLRMNNIQNGRVLLENLKYVPDSLEELPRLYLKNGNLLFNRTNSYELVGKTGVFKGEDDEYTFASYLIRVSFFQDFVNIDYINSYFNSSTCRLTQIEPHITQQTGQANFNGTKLKNIVIPLPPLAEQERIVKRVEQLLSLCDALEARLRSAEEERDRLVHAVMARVGGEYGQ